MTFAELNKLNRLLSDISYSIEKTKGVVLYPKLKEVVSSIEEGGITLINQSRQMYLSTTLSSIVGELMIKANSNNPVHIGIVSANRDLSVKFIHESANYILAYGEKFLNLTPDYVDINELNHKKSEVQLNESTLKVFNTTPDSFCSHRLTHLFIDNAAHIKNLDEIIYNSAPCFSGEVNLVINSTPKLDDPDNVFNNLCKCTTSLLNNERVKYHVLPWFYNTTKHTDLLWINYTTRDTIESIDSSNFEYLLSEGYEPTSKFYREQSKILGVNISNELNCIT